MSSDWNYEGVAAESYDLWFGDEPYEDQKFYQDFIREQGGAALEIGSGTGRLLLLYLRDGLDVEGLDSSTAMLDICRKKARRLGLSPVLHCQRMQALSLERRYRTLFVPFCSFQILAERDEAFEALRRFAAHLEPGGLLLVPLFVPWEDFRRESQWRLRRSGVRPSDGSTILIHECTRCDHFEQLQNIWLRYELYRDGRLIHSELRTHTMRWYYRYEFAMMLERSGFSEVKLFDYSGSPARHIGSEVVFAARVR